MAGVESGRRPVLGYQSRLRQGMHVYLHGYRCVWNSPRHDKQSRVDQDCQDELFNTITVSSLEIVKMFRKVVKIACLSRSTSPSLDRCRVGLRSHEIIITPILFLLEVIFCKHPIVALGFLLLFPYFTLLLFLLLLSDQLFFSLVPSVLCSFRGVWSIVMTKAGDEEGEIDLMKGAKKKEKDVHVQELQLFSSYLPTVTSPVCPIHDPLLSPL
jgi:hypothetical protein